MTTIQAQASPAIERPKMFLPMPSRPGQIAESTLGTALPGTTLHGESVFGGHVYGGVTDISNIGIVSNDSGRGGPPQGMVVRFTWMCRCGSDDCPEFPARPRSCPFVTVAPVPSGFGPDVSAGFSVPA